MHFCLLFRYVCQLCLSSLDCFCWRLCTSPNIVSMATPSHRRKLYLQCTCCTIVKGVDLTGSVFVYTGSDAVQFHDRMDSIQWVLLSLLCNGFCVYFKPEWTVHQHVFIACTGMKLFKYGTLFSTRLQKKYRLLYVSCNVLLISRYET